MKRSYQSKDIVAAFKSVLVKRFPASTLEQEPAKHLSTNTRIQLSKEATGDANGSIAVVKLKKYIMARIPRARFEPVLLLTNKARFLLFGAQLSPHGGHVAVELARQVAKKHGSKLVVLDRHVLVFDIMDLFALNARSDGVKNSVPPLMKLIDDGIDKFQAMNDDFHERVGKVID
nr:hypothetical protein [Candidatus Sigynarchaeota archaeon]